MRIYLQYFIIFIFLSLPSFAQEGNMYVQNYEASLDFGTNTSIIQTDDGMMRFANTKGVLTYDGVEWNLEEVTGTAFVLKDSPKYKSKIFIGGKEYFGILIRQKTGKYRFKDLSETFEDVGLVEKIIVANQKVFYYTNVKIYIHDLKTQKTTTLDPPKNKIFTGWFEHKDRVILNVQDKGLFYFKRGKLARLITDKSFAKLNIQTFFDFDKETTMVGTSDNNLYIYDGNIFTRFNTSVQNYLFEFVLREGLFVILGCTITFIISLKRVSASPDCAFSKANKIE